MSEIAFRTECYGSKKRKIDEVLYHEMFELGNVDIPCTVSKKYFGFNPLLRFYIFYMIKKIEGFKRIKESRKNKFVKTLIKKLKQKTKKNLEYVLWLSNEKIVNLVYDGNEMDVYCYPTSEYILSDEVEGSLYAYEKLPNPIYRIEKK